MISLFNIPQYTIDTSKFKNLLHDKVVEDFTQEFCKYVGASYGCAVNSATNAIFLALENKKNINVSIPSMIPPVVGNAVKLAGGNLKFTDDTEWVGHSYTLHNFGDYKIIDSAQRVDKNQFSDEANDDDLMIFSFYPTKPVGGMDGGMIVSNDKEKIDYFRHKSFNGMLFSQNNWEREQVSLGWKMYLNSAQAYVALQSLRNLENKNKKLNDIREAYNKAFDLDNKSNHLYRILSSDREILQNHLKANQIATGIHYHCLHKHPLFDQGETLTNSEYQEDKVVSLPFHENLTFEEVEQVICQTKLFQKS